VAVSFIGGGSLSTRRKPQPAASHWQTLLHNAVKQVHSPWAGFELTMLIGTDFAYVVVNPTSIQSRRPLKAYVLFINLCTIIMCIKYFCHDFFGYMWEGGVDFILWKCPRYFQVTTTYAKSVPINIVSSNPAHGECTCFTALCNKVCQWLAAGCGFLRVLELPPPIKLTATKWLRYCWKWH
jgi:hypothetical protein